jgi:hypothetical protein
MHMLTILIQSSFILVLTRNCDAEVRVGHQYDCTLKPACSAFSAKRRQHLCGAGKMIGEEMIVNGEFKCEDNTRVGCAWPDFAGGMTTSKVGSGVHMLRGTQERFQHFRTAKAGYTPSAAVVLYPSKRSHLLWICNERSSVVLWHATNCDSFIKSTNFWIQLLHQRFIFLCVCCRAIPRCSVLDDGKDSISCICGAVSILTVACPRSKQVHSSMASFYVSQAQTSESRESTPLPSTALLKRCASVPRVPTSASAYQLIRAEQRPLLQSVKARLQQVWIVAQAARRTEGVVKDPTACPPPVGTA